MQRKIILICAAVFVFMNVNVFAKQSANITDSDVKLFAQELPSIMDDIEALGIDDEDETQYEDTKLLREILVNHGFEEENCVEKFNMILLCMSKMKIEKEIDDMPFFLRGMYRKQIKKELDKEINSEDEKVVRRNEKYLEEKLGSFFEEEE